ncbi:fungal-specific transcription factor domain-containing protein [Aspergillus pseudoustus]|uniref:Fungal-specific transcription factor domain-containing protein n=1 Tax=Aspergillus pseudoustus TaxID=1810923 RepID=A0ABR4J6Z3_9EURO
MALSYLSQLERNRNHSASPGGDQPAPNSTREESETAIPQEPELPLPLVPRQSPCAEPEINNPIHEPSRLFHLDQRSRQQQFVGESTCLAFSERIIQFLRPRSATPLAPPERRYVRSPAFARQLESAAGCNRPERIRTYLLVRVALRFIGQDYHFFLHGDFLQQLDEAYRVDDTVHWDPVWACKLFVVLALGELYSGSSTTGDAVGASNVPGTEYFLVAVRLLQDLFEEPSLAQIETMLLFCFYSNALGRVNSAHMYSGIAMRLSTSLGLHRNTPVNSHLAPVEREHRIRLWWTVYVFDRSTCSKLGQPTAIHDADIDVEMPSQDTVEVGTQSTLGRPEHLVAHIKLARITGHIMRDIYGPSATSARAGAGRFVQNVRAILQQLRDWDVDLPESLRWNQDAGVLRSVASLQLHFNQCIILTTRPVLLYVLKARNPFLNASATSTQLSSRAGATVPTISDTTRSLADACISASRTSNSILAQLYIENSLATFGYFDAHHLFASTLVLIISAIISPNLPDSDAVQTALQMLRAMRDKGNATAGQYFSRLAQIQWNVSRLVSRGSASTSSAAAAAASAAMNAEEGAAQGSQAGQHRDTNRESPVASSPSIPGLMELDNCDWGSFLIPVSFNLNDDAMMMRTATADPLDSPFLQAFLDHADAEQDGVLASVINNVEEMEFVL